MIRLRLGLLLGRSAPGISGRAALGLGLAAGGLALLGLAAQTRTLERDDLPPTLPGEMLDWCWRGWRVRYTRLGRGPAVLLLHGLHSAASSFETQTTFLALADRHTVYAPDLVGFGKSDRPAIRYHDALYDELVRDFVDKVIGAPCAVVAWGSSMRYACRAAMRGQDRVERLVLVDPTIPSTALGRRLARAVAHGALTTPVLGQAAFNLLVSRRAIRRRLARQNPAIPRDALEQTVDQLWETAHQRGARHAAAAVVGGRIGVATPADLANLAQPVSLAFGSRLSPAFRQQAARLRALAPRAVCHVAEATASPSSGTPGSNLAALVARLLE